MGTAVAPTPAAKSQRVSGRNPLLDAGGYFSLAFVVFQLSAIWWPASVIRYFGGPARLSIERPMAYAAVCVVAAVGVGVFGLYALSGAGRIRHLPLLRTGLVVATMIYLLRGLVAIPQLPMVLKHPEFARFLIFSLISLAVGVVHAIGFVKLLRRQPGSLTASTSGASRIMLILLGACLSISCSASEDPLVKIRPDFLGRVVELQRFARDSSLRFDSHGQPLDKSETGPWTLYSKIGIRSLALKQNKLKIAGERIYIEFLNDQQMPVTRHEKVRIEINFDAPPTEALMRAALDRVFVPETDRLSDYVPEMWKHYLRQHEGVVTSPIVAPASGPISKIGGGVSPPKAVYAPDPDYTEIRKLFRLNGTSGFWLIVDETGHPTNIVVLRPLGLGLDEKAMERISTWRFNPSKRGDTGEPVKVQINVEVNFRIY